jgi:hypothetical protein
MSFPWWNLRLSPKHLVAARLQCHHAVQINTRLARGFVAPQSDDSHTSLTWDAPTEALRGEAFLAGGQEVRASLRLRDLTLGFNGREFALDSAALTDGLEWLAEQLRALGLDPAPLFEPIHFELEDHPLLHGGKFEAVSRGPELEELARYYGNAAECIGNLAQPVRCWPHHFDIATLTVKGEGTIGIGMSPGDGSYAEPYFYVSPTPAPAADALPSLHSAGRWHTEGWTGAVLTGSQFAGESNQETLVRMFLEDALSACKRLP